MIKQSKSRKIVLTALIVLIAFSVGFIVNEHLSPRNQMIDAYALSDEKANSVDRNLVSSNTKFALNIFKEISIEEGSKNVFISPLSISIALSMTFNGAEGTTKDAMARVLQFGNMSLEEINQEYLNLIESLKNVDKHVQLSIANSIWIRDSFKPLVKQDFQQRVEDYFKSDVFTRDFGNPQTPNEINAWLSNETGGKIDKMVDQIDPELVMFLINAIYFKGEWLTSFNETATGKGDFHLSNGSVVKVDMMSTRGNFSYYEGENFRAARFPYGRDKIAMYVFLPNRNITLDLFIDSLNLEAWQRYISGFRLIEGLEVKFPKFKLEYGVKRLNDVLEKLGMEVAFDPFHANFRGIAPTDLFIDFVDHMAVIEVNEKGTVAAAATTVGVSLTAVPTPTPTFVVDRPFFFVIRDDRSGTILFMGKVVDPTAT
ncbi:MAG: serpin family protein [Candidatus Bathyarchaeia archaeon]|nr:serpin family protein [Candidatus Bathyarchaeota archaeon]